MNLEVRQLYPIFRIILAANMQWKAFLAANLFAVLAVLIPYALYENGASSVPRRLMTSLLPADTSWTLLPAVVVFLAFALIIVYMVSPALKRRRFGVSNELTIAGNGVKGSPTWARKNECSMLHRGRLDAYLKGLGHGRQSRLLSHFRRRSSICTVLLGRRGFSFE